MKKITLFTAAAVSLTIFSTMSMTTEAANCNANYKQISCNNKIVLSDSNTADIQSVLNSLKEQQGNNCQTITIPCLPSKESTVENTAESAKTEKSCVKVLETTKPADNNGNQRASTDKPRVKVLETIKPANNNCNQNTSTKKSCEKVLETTQPANNNCSQSSGTNKPGGETPVTQMPDVSQPETKVPEQKAPEVKETEESKQLTYAEQVVNLVNAERAKNGLQPLTIKEDVRAAAQIRAVEIQTSFSHTRPDGKSFVTALQEQNVSYRGAGENIAWGQRTPEQVVEAWMNSEGHRANILNAKYTSIGVGYYQNAKGVNYWTQLFTY